MNQKVEKVSVIMPAYNAECFIEEAILSVVKQSYENWKLYIYNDGSKDKTVDVIKRLLEQYPEKIIYIDGKINKGTVAGLNTLIDTAQGEYLCWLSADDMYTEDMLRDSVAFLEEKKEFDLVFSDYETIDEHSNFMRESPYIQGVLEMVHGNETQPYRHLLTVGCCIHGCTVMFRKECLQPENRFRKQYRYAHDYDLWLRMAAQYKIGYIDKIHVKGREYSTQISKQGHNEVDAIQVLFDFVEADQFRMLCAKAGFKNREAALTEIIKGQLRQFKHKENEFSKLMKTLVKEPSDVVKEFWKNEKNEEILEFVKWIENGEWNLQETFFEDDTSDSYMRVLCDALEVDGFLINKQAIRFERFKGNSVKRFNMGLMRDNGIVIGSVSKEKIVSFLETEKKDYRWYNTGKSNDTLDIIISTFMYYKTDIAERLKFENVKFMDTSIWWELVKNIRKQEE